MTGNFSDAVAALYVEKDGAYFGLPGIDPWPIDRDARTYQGSSPVVAHPDCRRWGQYGSGHPTKPGAYVVGDDGGCFEAALASVRQCGGVLEHPAYSKAWSVEKFCLIKPDLNGGWTPPDAFGGRSCHVEQGHYGHFSRKKTWLYACGVDFPELIWGPSPQRIHPRALELHGYEKARRIGVMAMVGGKNKTRIRNATPPQFRDLLIGIARTACGRRVAAE